MKKEALTTENIKKDLKRNVFIQSIGMVYSLLLLSIIYLLMQFDLGPLFKTIFTIVFLVQVGVILYELITTVICLRLIKKESFTITLDHVIEKKDKRKGTRFTTAKPYRLVFAKSGTYSLPYGKLYYWSDMFATTGRTLYEFTEINEEFYVISTWAQKNIIAYRTKHFELKEHKELL